MFYAKILNCQEKKKKINQNPILLLSTRTNHHSSSRDTGNELHQVLEAFPLKNLKVSTFPNLEGTGCPESVHLGPEGRGWP